MPSADFWSSIAVAHEHYYERGGGEYVAEELARTFDAPLYTGFINDEALPEERDVEFHDLFGDGVTGQLIRRSTFFRDFYYQFAWQYVPELTDYDVLVQSGNNPGWYVPPDEQVLVKYVHSPPRTAYDRFHERGDNLLTRLYAYASRVLYQPNIHYPDVYVANSELVARRIRRYWGIEDVEVVYPPTATETYEPAAKEDFYLSYSRLTANKRFDEIIEAFREHPDKRLVIGGSGPQEAHLRELADGMDNVEFRGYLDEDEKRDLLGRAKALVYAAENEDFGMVPIEAFASGTPVIGVEDGYTKYQVEDGENGLLYPRGVDSLSDAIGRFEANGVSLDAAEIAERAEKYSMERFRERMREVVENAVADASIEVGVSE